MKGYLIDQPVQWYKDNKLMIGVVLIIISFILGFYGKVIIGKAIILAKLYEPVEVFTGISIGILIWAFSWVLLFIGAFIVGWRTVKRIQFRIHHHVKRTVKRTYRHAKKLPGKSLNYTKKLHRKSMDRITTASKRIADKIREQNG